MKYVKEKEKKNSCKKNKRKKLSVTDANGGTGMGINTYACSQDASKREINDTLNWLSNVLANTELYIDELDQKDKKELQEKLQRIDENLSILSLKLEGKHEEDE